MGNATTDREVKRDKFQGASLTVHRTIGLGAGLSVLDELMKQEVLIQEEQRLGMPVIAWCIRWIRYSLGN